MAREQLKTLTEPMYYMLLALVEERHGYGIMQRITEMTEGRVEVGAGTLYALLGRFEKEEIILQTREADRKKFYRMTTKGEEILGEEYRRLNQLVKDGAAFFDGDGNLFPPSGGSGSDQQEEIIIVTETEPQEGFLGQAEKSPTGEGRETDRESKKARDRASRPRSGLGKRFHKGLATT